MNVYLDTFAACAASCMDGRSIRALEEYAQKHLDRGLIDQITLPGMDGHIRYGNREVLEGVKKAFEISTTRHGSKKLFIVGHADCAGNPVSKEQHITDIRRCMEIAETWEFQAEINGLFVDRVDGKWMVTDLITAREVIVLVEQRETIAA